MGSNPIGGMDVCYEFSMSSGRGLCDELITRPEESCRLYCVIMCDLETSRIGAPYTYDISSLTVKSDTHISKTYKCCPSASITVCFDTEAIFIRVAT